MRFRCQGPSLVVDTPAKLNLFLDVRGKRPDGYHELETLMVSIGLFDTLRFSPRAKGIGLQVRSAEAGCADLSSGPDNLVLRAASRLAAEADCDQGVSIELEKRIPLQSGLGGGSSDAAAALVGLNRFWKLNLSQEKLHQLAAELGSDVNFFLDSHPLAVCRGRGERVDPARLGAPLHFVLVRPRTGLSTADVFRAWRPAPASLELERLLASLRAGHSQTAGRQLHNALQAPAIECNSEIDETMQTLSRLPLLGAAMTGSGSVCFGMCGSRPQAKSIAGRLRARTGMRAWIVATSV